jgi:hypothetical protein
MNSKLLSVFLQLRCSSLTSPVIVYPESPSIDNRIPRICKHDRHPQECQPPLTTVNRHFGIGGSTRSYVLINPSEFSRNQWGVSKSKISHGSSLDCYI